MATTAYVFPGGDVVVRALRRRRLASQRAVAGTNPDGCSQRAWSVRTHTISTRGSNYADTRREVAKAALVWKPTRLLLCAPERARAERRLRRAELHDVTFGLSSAPRATASVARRGAQRGPLPIGQLLNHFPRSKLLTTKDGLLRTLLALYAERGAAASKASGANAFIGAAAAERARIAGRLYAFMPPTLALPFRSDARGASAAWRQFERWFQRGVGKRAFPARHAAANVWIVKPVARNCGRGIEVFSTLRDIRRFTHASAGAGARGDFVIQKYIERPLLWQGRKFDIRVWVVVTEPFEGECSFIYRYSLRESCSQVDSLPYHL